MDFNLNAPLKVFLVKRQAIGPLSGEAIAMVVVAKDEKHAIEYAQKISLDFKRCSSEYKPFRSPYGSVVAKEVDLTREACILCESY